MRPTNYLPRPALLLSALTGVSLFAAPAFAQKSSANDNKNTDSAANDKTTAAPDSAKTTAAADTKTVEPASTSEAPQVSTTSEKPADPTSTTENKPETTSQPETTSLPETTSQPETTSEADKTTSTSVSESSTTTTEDIQSTITSISDGNTDAGLTGLPTLTKVTAIPTYPAPTVPPTKDAPFMQHSSAPDGTVFIAVGAILGAFGLAILLWRAIVGFLLHRSVERAARAQHVATAKSGFPAPPAPFYKYTDHASTMSLSAGRGVRRTTRGPVLSSTPSQSNLFFSPTAAASRDGAGNRGSTFLPSGFYAAGNSPGPGHDHSISLTNLRPDSRGQFGNPSRNTLGPSPPDSPSFNARRDISSSSLNPSSLNLNRPPSQRAPSAFLEDLLADDPSSLPPPQMPPSSSHRHSGYGSSSPGPQNRF